MDAQPNSSIAQQFPRDANYRISSKWMRSTAHQICIAALIAGAYYLGTKIGFFLTPRGATIAMYWPPNAILLGAFLLLAPRLWYGVILAVLLVHLLAQAQSGVPVSTALGWFAGNVSEALLGAALLYRFNNRKMFDSVRGTVLFLVFAAFLAPFATSFLDAAVVVITHWGRDLRQLEEKVSAVSESTRELSHGLHPVQLEYLGLALALRRLCSRVQNEAGIDIRFQEKILPPLPVEISLNFFRVAQEALRNVVKHSHADMVDVEVGINKNHIVLQVTDNGLGLTHPEEQKDGLGLVNMKERLKSIGGTITFSSTVRKGTTIKASVPFG